MIRNEATFNGKSLSDFNAYVANSNFLDGAAKDYNSTEIPGRSGNLQINNGRFKNLSLKVQLYIVGNLVNNMDGLRNYLESCDGYCRYTETLRPGQFRMGLFKDVFAPGDTDPHGGEVTVTFDCKPQRYLTSGENAIDCTSVASLTNPTRFPSAPLIRLYGTGTLNINNMYITVASHPYEYIDVDCDLMDARHGLTNCNSYVTFSTSDYITLSPGANGIDNDGFTTVEITPRWYEI